VGLFSGDESATINPEANRETVIGNLRTTFKLPALPGDNNDEINLERPHQVSVGRDSGPYL
jgi:hypothetical protein